HRTSDFTEYDVRAFGLRSGRLRPGVIADRRSGEWKMQGLPMVRLQRRGGDWAYTLYSGGDKGAFVHALDTATATARCIDLPTLPADVTTATLRRVGDRLVVSLNGRAMAAIDTRTLAVVHPHVAVRENAVAARPSTRRWQVLAALVLAAVAAGAVGVRRRMPHNPAGGRQT
ncbi:MAG TPA: hypothetical protein VFL90_18955, partial [Methylomirabilota bacterium]|nr:hypothetical protein [Methylomirabilota bacterium]